MHDPKLIDPPAQRIPDEWRRQYQRRPLDKLPGDLIKAFDLIEQRRREQTRIDAKMLEAERRTASKIWIRILAAAVVAQWGVILLFLDKVIK